MARRRSTVGHGPTREAAQKSHPPSQLWICVRVLPDSCACGLSAGACGRARVKLSFSRAGRSVKSK